MKMIIAFVSSDDCSGTIRALNNEGYEVTRLHSTGGFWGTGNATLLVGTQDEKIRRAIEIIKADCSVRTDIVAATGTPNGEEAMPCIPVEIKRGGATIFVMDIEHYEKLS